MTVGELIAELSKFDPSHLACVKLYSRTYPAESQVFAQGVFHVPPWHEGGAGWVGIVADADNRERVEGCGLGAVVIQKVGGVSDPPHVAEG